MQLYDQEIRQLLDWLKKQSVQEWTQDSRMDWPMAGKEQLVLRSDMAFELGGDGREAVSGLAFTQEEALVPEDRVTLVGPDLQELTGDCDYARMTLVRLHPAYAVEEEQKLYHSLRQVDYVRYRMYPEGYMMRISSVREREPVRVSRQAIAQGISFARIGACFHKRYQELPQVAAVHTIFITQPDVLYSVWREHAHRMERITSSLQHIFENVAMDCTVCGLKEVCDEVEELRQMHFRQEKQERR